MGGNLLRYFLLLPGIITFSSAHPEFLGIDHAIVIDSSTLLRGSTLNANCLIKPNNKPKPLATSTAHQHKDFYTLAPATGAFGERVNQSYGNNSILPSNSDLSTIPLYSTTSTFYENSVFPSCSVNWKLNSTVVTNTSPGTIYADLSSRLTLNNFSVAAAWLHCYIKCPDRPHFHLAKAWLRSGCVMQFSPTLIPIVPPQKPKNLSCILKGDENGPLQCQFDAGLDPGLVTNYSLVVHKSGDRKTFVCNLSSCQHTSPRLPKRGTLSMQVVASNDLGTYPGETFNVSSSLQLVLPDAPLHLRLEPQDKSSCCSLKASWNPEEKFSYQLRYSVDEPGVPPNRPQIIDLINNSKHYTIHKLLPFHHYVAYLRQRVHPSGHWSKWSQKARNRTSEKVPAKSPDVWRVIDVKESGQRDVTIYWKNMTERELSGQLQRYRVDVWPGSNGLRRNRTECESLATECHVQLDSGNYTISVSVENGAGWGQEKGWISIPSAGRIGLEAPRDVSTRSAGNSALNVSWDAPSPTTCCHLKFVLAWAGCEWKGRPQGWLRVGPKIRSCVVPGLEPMRCYKVSVHASYSVGDSEAASVWDFSQEGVPLMAPNITTLEPGKTWLFLSWHSLPMDTARGHVLQYIVNLHKQPPDKYDGKAQTWKKTSSPSSTLTPAKKVKGDTRNAELQGLQPGTKYSVSVLARTKAGQGPLSPEQVFITPLYAPGELQVQVVIPCLLVLLFISCGVAILHRRGSLKQHLWPPIPDLENTTLRIFLESQAMQSQIKHQAMVRTTNESLSVSAVVEVPFLNFVQPLCTSAPALDNLCQDSEMDEDHREACDPLDSYQDHGGPTWSEIINEQQVDNESEFEASLNESHKESYENESRLDIDAPYESNMNNRSSAKSIRNDIEESGNEPTELPATMPSDSRQDGPLTEPCSFPDVGHHTSKIPSTWDSDYERQIFVKSLEMGSTGIISKVPFIHNANKAKLQPGEVYPSLQHLDMEQKTIDAIEPSTDFSFLLALK